MFFVVHVYYIKQTVVNLLFIYIGSTSTVPMFASHYVKANIFEHPPNWNLPF